MHFLIQKRKKKVQATTIMTKIFGMLCEFKAKKTDLKNKQKRSKIEKNKLKNKQKFKKNGNKTKQKY